MVTRFMFVHNGGNILGNGFDPPTDRHERTQKVMLDGRNNSYMMIVLIPLCTKSRQAGEVEQSKHFGNG